MSATLPAFALALAWLAAGLGAPQESTARDKPKAPPRSYTNDDLERYRFEREAAGPSAVATPAPAVSESSSGEPSNEEGSDGGASAARYEELRGELTAAEAARDETRAQLRRIESRLNPLSAEFEVDPNTILRLQADQRDVRAQLEEQEAVVRRAREALEAFEDEARRNGVRLPPRP